MIKSKGILTISIISLFAVESAYAAIASSGYVDQQVGTKISEVHATTVASDETANVVTSISADGNTVTATKGITAEETANKVTTIRTVDAATDVAYPSEKAVATALDAKQDKLEGEVLTNTATGSGSVSTGGANVAATTDSVVIGNGSSVADSSNSSVVVGYGSSVASDANNSSVFGASASSSGRTGVAIGSIAQVTEDAGVAVGFGTVAGNASIALGSGAVSPAEHAIQLGYGENSEANTLSVGLSTSNNYKLLGSDGKIPAERLPFEGDVLTNTATGSNSFSTGGATAVSVSSSVALGNAANASAGAAVAVGVSSGASAKMATALGTTARAEGQSSLAVGGQSQATKLGSTAVGPSTSSTGTGAVALGGAAKSSADYAIQLGAGTNSEANTLSVGLSETTNYKLLGSDGKIPAERLPVANASSLGGVKSGGDISISSTGAVSVVSALKAVRDANGANIAATYATKASVEDLNNNKVQKDWTTSNINKVLVIGSDDNYPDVLGKVTVARITENFLDDAIQNKLDTAVTNVTSSGTGSVIGGFSKSGNTMTVTRTNVQIPVGSATATSYASIWVE